MRGSSARAISGIASKRWRNFVPRSSSPSSASSSASPIRWSSSTWGRPPRSSAISSTFHAMTPMRTRPRASSGWRAGGRTARSPAESEPRSTALLRRHSLTLSDIGLWELNEAFAAQVLACLAAWEDDTFCREVLGLNGAAGRIDRDKLNVDGGAIGLGHPVGASGNRIVLHLVNAMKRHGVKQGIATECIGGGQGGAMVIEAVVLTDHGFKRYRVGWDVSARN